MVKHRTTIHVIMDAYFALIQWMPTHEKKRKKNEGEEKRRGNESGRMISIMIY